MQPITKEERLTPKTSSAKCLLCDSTNMNLVMDFGMVALAGGFLKAEQFATEKKYPLRLFFCQDCYVTQVEDIVEPQVLFNNYFYFSSAVSILREHFSDYATEVTSRILLDPPNATLVEIGCNDGVLLKPFADQGIGTIIGVDPATNIVAKIDDPRIQVVNDFFSVPVARKIKEEYGAIDLVVANNVYAHISDIRGVTQGISELLADEGVFVFENHYLQKVLFGLQYDMVYHEHLFYYSLLALKNHLERYGLMIFDVKPIPIHAGSMRFYACRKGTRRASAVSPRVAMLERDEQAKGLNRVETYMEFANHISNLKEKLMDLLERLNRKEKRVVGYGASGRANTIIQYCGIDHTHLKYIIDDAPAKEGFYTPGSHFLIQSNKALLYDQPDYILIFAWSYFNDIADKCQSYMDRGGRLIVPLPDVRITIGSADAVLL